MKHESNETSKIEITDGKYTFSDIYQKDYTPHEIIDVIKQADILILPYEGFRDRSDYLFPEETFKLYDYIKGAIQVQGESLTVEICSSDEEYKELELHADVINIANIIVNSSVYAIVVGIITSYLYDKLKKYNKKDINTNVSITVETDGESKTIRYEGSIENFESAMKSVDEYIIK